MVYFCIRYAQALLLVYHFYITITSEIWGYRNLLVIFFMTKTNKDINMKNIKHNTEKLKQGGKSACFFMM